VDTAIKILMAVVIGGLVLAGLYALFGETVLFSSRYKHDRKCYA
jgi:lipopolysaccharide export LptBFGC system permease protein LptF